jgi:glycine cleavage system H protein
VNIPQNMKYSKSHEWVLDENGTVTVGITAYAQDQLGDIVFIELPKTGQEIKAGESFGSIESVKSVSELVSPVSGSVSEVNEAVRKAPEMVNADAYGKGWMIRVKSAVMAEGLMSPEQYKSFVEEET